MKEQRIYLDAAPIIYTVEQVAPYFAAVDLRLAQPGCVLVTSELARLECRVKPLREKEEELLRDYDEYFENAVSEFVPLSREVIDLATKIRAEYGFKTPDAIHLAAAIQAGCDVFYTNDHRLDKYTAISIEIVAL